MDERGIPFLLDRFCRECGTELEFTDVAYPPSGEGHAHTTCPICGKEDDHKWWTAQMSTMTRIEDLGQGDVTNVATAQGQIGLRINPDGSAEGFEVDQIPAKPPSIEELSEEQQAEMQRMIDRFALHQAPLAEVVARAGFRFFALSRNGFSLVPTHFSLTDYQGSTGYIARHEVSSIEIAYADSTGNSPSGTITIRQGDAAEGARNVVSESHSIVAVVERAFRHGTLNMRQIAVGEGATYRYVNVKAIEGATVTQWNAHIASGESTQWDMRAIDAPDPLLHARTLVEGTQIDVVCTGIFVGNTERILSRFIRADAENTEVATDSAHLLDVHEQRKKRWQRISERGF